MPTQYKHTLVLEGYDYLEGYMPLPCDRVRVRRGHDLDYIEVAIRDGELEVRAGNDVILVLPRAANVITVNTKRGL